MKAYYYAMIYENSSKEYLLAAAIPSRADIR